MTVLAISDILNSLDQFLSIFAPCVLASAIIHLLFFIADNNLSLSEDLRYNFTSQMHREAFKLLTQGLSEEEILLKLRGMRFSFHLFPATRKKTRKMVRFAEAVLNNDRMMLQYVIVPVFDRKSFKALKHEMKSVLLNQEKERIKDKAFLSLRSLLQDHSKENVAKYQDLLVKLHQKPFVLADIVGADCSVGKNTAYVYRALQLLESCNTNLTYENYIQCLQQLNLVYGGMYLITSKGAISQNLRKLDDQKSSAVHSWIEEQLNAFEEQNEKPV